MRDLSFLRNKWVIFAMIFACWGSIASLMAGYYWLQYTDVSNRIGGALIYVDVGVDYGNGSRTFYNDTKTLTGMTLFDVTKQLTNVTYNVTLLGTEVLSINGVSKQGSFGWTYWIWNGTDRSWSIVWENADQYRVSNQETYVWYYTNSFNPPPT